MLLQRIHVVSAFAAALSLLNLSAGNAGSVQKTESMAQVAMMAFAENCFSPFMTAARSRMVFEQANIAYDFYDLDPFSSAAPSPALGRSITIGTDRRCEVSFGGSHANEAVDAVLTALDVEGLQTAADVPAHFSQTATTHLLAARRLNPVRVAVVHVGTRQGLNGTETFMLVERLLPENGKG